MEEKVKTRFAVLTEAIVLLMVDHLHYLGQNPNTFNRNHVVETRRVLTELQKLQEYCEDIPEDQS